MKLEHPDRLMKRTPLSLAALETHDAFAERHIGPDAASQQAMLDTLGFATRAALIDAVIPASIRRAETLPLGPFAQPLSEAEALAALRELADKNQVFRSYIGQGYYDTHTPAVILRNVLENPAWYTAYTPYQPEISQGRLEALLNFQQMVADLTGLEISNASLLDEATAAAEAMTLLQRVGKPQSNVFYVADDVLPQTLEVIKTRAKPIGIEVKSGPAADAAAANAFGVLLQYPGVNGDVRDYRALADAIHAAGGHVVVAADILALTVLTPPGEWGADVAVGNTQRFGVPMGFGGPHAAYMAVRDEFKRQMPGRLVGVTVDAQGKPALRLALQTREQHIRREKATSNVCTAQALLAIMASMYAVYHGPRGLKTIALRVNRIAALVAAGVKQLGFATVNDTFFDTLTIDTGARTAQIHALANAKRINLRRVSDTRVGISVDETTTRGDLAELLGVFAQAAGGTAPDVDALDAGLADTAALPAGLQRTSAYLTHHVFNRHHSETEMLRYLRSLSDKDLALDRSMIPLGSCTMKLNATSEMLPVTWPEFGRIHPFAPAEQTVGYREMIDQLEQMLVAATGYAAVSLQPNAGSQGEYAGLLIIHAYHESRGESHRNVCLIPASAHGTNPASAHMAGMKVVVVACDAQGNVDIDDLKAKAEQHANDLAAIMITYPSTHGVFEQNVREICEIVHAHGGQVYVDGANMNAMVGLTAPGQFGGDVSHLNLHKTFCIPHGGGGPGVGPVAVGAHLAKFLPNQRSTGYARAEDGIGAVSAAPYGSASILPISWMYIAMMGAKNLTAATETAILNANYIAKRLAPHYPVLYSGPGGLVAHECILDLRPIKDSSGITVDDVAKRLMDYGFHAPTMSFPVPGTLMVEPTESESQEELDRFVAAMIAIRDEIRAVEEGRADREDNPLRHAPHTAAVVTANEWPHAYSREQAAYPVASLVANKYWPPVGRADNAYGDRNLFCSCVPVSDYA
ncbi:aminomethyl-transferring glycine dehydrogenase [Burkholderia thailandensis]|uniref:Glycine dehydrogenase (decarboxylating) n=1 Tax=Burkholderia thailandensis (strain ATCC 700388 / DSM 13276 / CCUG 48851 / CIP 106301 / E264) TaxID=271848 RepID=GCSP_BURTA|nr:aminomethyl-transferring glycine dehydrogenase [Burkholderia thailandensis]Q2STK2.1 RecName: Full=Glycine dehydrogenase (decarboxylating); AltName: Full=Glycine cleavage system P-protein; AltName: Full=Glycine decarboxylase; AltName: Full=Glycine dehydrogenase (aminomethyl-transferring) [Burkholderia thailandensis E264]ABC38436.1 glycine dehydrogenase [Burkholderia thailandensis E264]AHI73287.1 glycine dehydrogenase [Burkholderia thailandensis 2002721723]AHI80227.1 glycine dehydrogenase [Bur